MQKLCVPVAGGPPPPAGLEKGTCFCCFTSLETPDSRRSRTGPRSHRPSPPLGAAVLTTPRGSTSRGGRHHPTPSFPVSPDFPTTPRASARRFGVITARPVAWRCALTSSPRSLPPLRCSSFARWPSLSSTVERVLSVTSPLRHVPGRLLSADPGARGSKGPAGRSRTGLHAPDDQQEGFGPGVFGQLSGALLAGRPS